MTSCKKSDTGSPSVPLQMKLKVTALPSGVSDQLQSVFFVNGKDGFVSGYKGGIYKTTDSAKTWTALNSTVSLPVYGLYFLDASKGFAVGGDDGCSGNGCTIPGGFILKTADGGQTWTRAYTPSTPIALTSITFTSAAVGYCTGTNKVLKTTDGGQSWSEYLLSGLASKPWQIFFMDAQKGFIITTSSQLITTVDGGTSWQANSSPLNVNYYGFAAAGGSVYLANQSQVLKSTNSGGNWNTLAGSPTFVRSLYFIDANNGLSFGAGNYSGGDFGHYNGAIYVTTDGGGTWSGSTNYTAFGTITTVHFPNNNVGYGLSGNTVVRVNVQ